MKINEPIEKGIKKVVSEQVLEIKERMKNSVIFGRPINIAGNPSDLVIYAAYCLGEMDAVKAKADLHIESLQRVAEVADDLRLFIALGEGSDLHIEFSRKLQALAEALRGARELGAYRSKEDQIREAYRKAGETTG
jgi:hypothetical protein